MVISPSVGRIVHYFPHKGDTELHTEPGPLAAVVCKVHSDTLVNLTVFGPTGLRHGRVNVPLVQPDMELPEGAYAAWMPFQVGQAQKTEQLQNALKEMQGSSVTPMQLHPSDAHDEIGDHD